MSKHNIIFIAVEPFEHYTWRRRHHVAWRLAKENRVLWVAPPIPLIGLFFPRHYNLTHYSLKTFFNLARLRHQGRNLWVYCPVQLLPTWHKIPAIARFNKHLFIRTLQRVVKNLGTKMLCSYRNSEVSLAELEESMLSVINFVGRCFSSEHDIENTKGKK